jgi:hypothetical protein
MATFHSRCLSAKAPRGDVLHPIAGDFGECTAVPERYQKRSGVHKDSAQIRRPRWRPLRAGEPRSVANLNGSLQSGNWCKRRVSLVFVGIHQGTPNPRRETCGAASARQIPSSKAGIIERASEGPGESDALVKLADRQQSGVAGKLAWRRFDHERNSEELQDLRPVSGYTYRLSP